MAFDPMIRLHYDTYMLHGRIDFKRGRWSGWDWPNHVSFLHLSLEVTEGKSEIWSVRGTSHEEGSLLLALTMEGARWQGIQVASEGWEWFLADSQQGTWTSVLQPQEVELWTLPTTGFEEDPKLQLRMQPAHILISPSQEPETRIQSCCLWTPDWQTVGDK